MHGAWLSYKGFVLERLNGETLFVPVSISGHRNRLGAGADGGRVARADGIDGTVPSGLLQALVEGEHRLQAELSCC